MTPAALRMNYIEEMKFCGDPLYKKNQFWEFINIRDNPQYADTLSKILSLDGDYIAKNGGAWLVNVTKPPNFDTLGTDDQTAINLQINEMIRNKYKFINYNGLRNSHLEILTANFTKNPFDNCVLIIDEAHNFVSRIVNKIDKPESLSMRLYEYILSATNMRIIFLTGTPIINYPNEIGILFNMLRGYIKTWHIPVNIKTGQKVNQDVMKKILSRLETLDFLEYKASTKILVVTRNPFGFIDKHKGGTYEGVHLDERGNMSDAEFEKLFTVILSKSNIEVLSRGIRIENFKALPDKLDAFKALFIDTDRGNIRNANLFKRRILGLTSYYRSAKEKLMPSYNPEHDLHVIKIHMSDYQFNIYEEARIEERKLEKASAKKKRRKIGDELYTDSVSTYRIFSRAFCNFVFPRAIGRPLPRDGEDIESALKSAADEDLLDAASVEQRINNTDGRFTMDDANVIGQENAERIDESYEQRIQTALSDLEKNAGTYLTPEGLETFSPKFLRLLENIQDVDHMGLNMIYSQFRTLEGVGILKLILENNGFVHFKIKRNERDQWIVDIPEDKIGTAAFALYTGTETAEEKEIIRNIFNSTWEYVPHSIKETLMRINNNNHLGEVIKVLMITSSGAEGITLRNVRYVHITEPYWHPVRIEQAIGRAVRICSHQDLPPDLQTVEVFQYIMSFTPEQLTSDASIELRLKDTSKIDKKTPLTSDEALYEISRLKEEINKQLLTSMKEAAMDCALHSSSTAKESLVCYSFGSVPVDRFSYNPSISAEQSDVVADINKTTIRWKAKELKISGKRYVLRVENNEVYDYDSYKQAISVPGVNPILIGKLEKHKGKFRFVKI